MNPEVEIKLRDEFGNLIHGLPLSSKLYLRAETPNSSGKSFRILQEPIVLTPTEMDVRLVVLRQSKVRLCIASDDDIRFVAIVAAVDIARGFFACRSPEGVARPPVVFVARHLAERARRAAACVVAVLAAMALLLRDLVTHADLEANSADEDTKRGLAGDDECDGDSERRRTLVTPGHEGDTGVP